MQSVKARSDKWSFELSLFLQPRIYLAQCCSFFRGHHAWLHNPTFFLSPLSKHSLGSTARGCLALYIDFTAAAADVNDYSSTTSCPTCRVYRTNRKPTEFLYHFRLLANGIQGLMFSVLWKYFMDAQQRKWFKKCFYWQKYNFFIG